MNTVIFDLGNVLVHWDWKGYLNSFDYDKKTFDTISNAMFLNKDWAYGDEGLVSPSEWLQLFIENAPDYEQQIREVYATLENCIYPYEYTLDLIQYYDDLGYRLFYLSNYSEGLYEKSQDRLSFIEAFEGGIFSYREKCIKPDAHIYQLLMERYKIEPTETIFYDDVMDNVIAAQKLGMHAVQFTPEVVSNVLNDTKNGETNDEKSS
ncbi:MAG: HAD family phosphatase [Lachnospiraceae bacterium]